MTEEDEKEEEEYRQEFADYSKPMWRLGGPVPSPKPNDEQSLHTGVYRKRLLATEADESASKRLKPSPHMAKANTTAPKPLTGQGTATILKPQQAKPKQHLGPVKFADDCIEAPVPRAFITDPTKRIIQCVKVLCGNWSTNLSLYTLANKAPQRSLNRFSTSSIRHSCNCWHFHSQKEQRLPKRYCSH